MTSYINLTKVVFGLRFAHEIYAIVTYVFMKSKCIYHKTNRFKMK